MLENDRLGLKNRCSITDVCPPKSVDAGTDIDFKAVGKRGRQRCVNGVIVVTCIRACPQVCGRQSASRNVIVGGLLPG